MMNLDLTINTDVAYQILTGFIKSEVTRVGYQRAVVGLSGGIDSALTLAIAVDALGAERVEAVMMPFRYTAAMSVEDAETQAKNLGVKFSCISIEPLYESFMNSLQTEFAGQARLQPMRPPIWSSKSGTSRNLPPSPARSRSCFPTLAPH